MKKPYVVAALCCVVEVSIAAGPPVQHQFQSGQRAVAAHVNENFQELADRIDAVPSSKVYRYQDYLGNNVIEKVFATSGGGACGDSETRSYSRTTEGANTRIVETHIKRTGATICHYRTQEKLATPTELQLLNWKHYNINDTSVLTQSIILNTSVPILTSTMRIGHSWGSASDATSTGTPPGDPGITEQNTLLGIEDVTVPYNTSTTFTNCLKIFTLRSTVSNGRFARVSWQCPGVGLVKQVQHSLYDGLLYKRELTSMTLQP